MFIFTSSPTSTPPVSSAAFQIEPELLAVDLAGGAEAEPGASPRVLHRAADFAVERNFLRYATNREVTDDAVVGTAARLEALRHKRDLRVVRCIEEIGRAEMVVAALVAGIDRRGLDRDGRAGGGQVRLVDMSIDRELLEATLRRRDDHVLDCEFDGAVGEVQGPGHECSPCR